MTVDPTGLNTPQHSIDVHQYSDLGQGANAQHHRLGNGPNDAAPGIHTHKLAQITDYVAPVIPPVALTHHEGVLAANVVGTGINIFQDIMSTANLEVGTWLINLDVQFISNTTVGRHLFTAVAGTATATFAGPTAVEVNSVPSTNSSLSASLTFIATVTVAGTLKFQFKYNSGTPTIEAATVQYAAAGATGYTAVKVV